jgi:DsbC/DsbD-like thiol-disulfide interchange protein
VVNGLNLLYLSTVALAAALAAAPGQAFRRNQPPRMTVDPRVSAPITKVPQTVSLTIAATPMPGVHVYSPGNAEYNAVAVTLMPVPGLTAGAPTYPPGETYFFAPLKQVVTVYSKPFVVTIPLTATAAFAKSRPAGDTVELKGSVDYQACDDKICFPPQSLPFTVQVPVTLPRK